MRRFIFRYIYSALLMVLFLGCGNRSEAWMQMNTAEGLLETRPDSALTVLSSIDCKGLAGDEEKARYALLKSMALDKNCIDTTTLDVLQPAIDYYLNKGDADEKLRTYYYQGRIYQNRGERDSALNSFVKAVDNSLDCTDTLTFVRTLVAQAYLYYEFYDFDSYVSANLRAAEISRKLTHKSYELNCLLNALNGAVILENRSLADSLIRVCNAMEHLDGNRNKSLLGYRLSYALKFGSEQDLRSLLVYGNEILESDINNVMNLASVYNKLGDNNMSRKILGYIDSQGVDYDTLKYQSIYLSVLKDIGDYREALSLYENFSRRVDALNTFKFEQKAQSINEKYRLELKAQHDSRRKSIIIRSCIGGIVVLVMGIFILVLLARSHKTQKDLAVQRAKAAGLENENLKSERENLALENKNLQLERDKKALEAENLAHRVEILENESESLKNLMEDQKGLPFEVQKAIQVRIEMLNSLFAGYITANEQFEKPYEIWVKELTENTEEFMNSNRLAFQVSHPRFIQYFEDRGLTVNEINYVCLYAIGLRGKEVGNYMKKRSHVNTSSAIRKKLGIDKHETNIGIYVRKLFKGL